MPNSPAPGSLSLFPNPNTSRPPPTSRNPTPRGGRRSSESRERRATTPLNERERRAPTPQTRPSMDQEPSLQQSPPRNNGGGRQTPLQNNQAYTAVAVDAISPQQQQPGRQDATHWPLGIIQPSHHQPSAPQAEREEDHHQQQHQHQHLPPPRLDTTSLGGSNGFRSSIAKHPLNDEEHPSSSIQHPPPALRSIFPTYNPELPLDQQEYAPTQVSPRRFPRDVISRQSYHDADGAGTGALSPGAARSPQANTEEVAGSRWGARPRVLLPQEAPTVPKTSTTEQLKSYWKVANGWQASSSEGRVYCMRLAQEKDAPVYTLSSATQPFYNVRLDPTSASAYVTVTRHDPSKPFKESSNGSGNGSGSGSSSPSGSSAKHWHEVLTTTMEEESRRHQPNDGLVALLMPTPATKMALERAADPIAVATAERECARLVWDDDSGNYFLVHPALATPFCVTIDRAPAWSRVEYTLEHHESPRHLAKLTRDATGAGWLEIDTGLASKIQSVYITDVAVTALVLVASADEKNQPAAVEAFEPPPPPAVTLAADSGGVARRDSGLGKILHGGSSRRDPHRNKTPMESFEIDVESQDDSMGKSNAKLKEGIERLPFVLRAPVKILKALFECFIWVLAMLFKCFKGLFCCCYSCVGSKY